MKCNNCGKENAQIIQEQEGFVDSNSLCKVLCIWSFCMPWGLYNLLNKKDTRKYVNYKYCPDCQSKNRI